MNSTAQEYIVAADRCEEVGLTVAAAALRRAAQQPRLELPQTFDWREPDGRITSHTVERMHRRQIVPHREITISERDALAFVRRMLVSDVVPEFDPRFPILLRFGARSDHEGATLTRQPDTIVTLDSAGVPAQETTR